MSTRGPALAAPLFSVRGQAVLPSALGSLAVSAWAWLLYQDWAMRHMDIVEMAMPSGALLIAWGAWVALGPPA